MIKKKMFGYNTSVICDNNNYILTIDTNGSNVHDSISFYDSIDNLVNNYDEYNDIYIYPNEKDLIPTGQIDKNGYMIYKSDSNDYTNCPLKERSLLYACMNLKKFALHHYAYLVEILDIFIFTNKKTNKSKFIHSQKHSQNA